MKKILTIIGARPQIIKAAAISRAIKNNFSSQIVEVILHTGQHYDENMSEVFFDELNIPRPDYNLRVGSSSHASQTANMLVGIENAILAEKPNAILVYGDTNSTLAGALAASKMNLPVIHIEAGLRSFNKNMPEEVNRILTDHVSTLLFSPTREGLKNLANEGFKLENQSPFHADNPAVFHCGDIMYDNSLYFLNVSKQKENYLLEHGLLKNKFILCTIHRNSNTDDIDKLSSIFRTIVHTSEKYNINFALPLHPRTTKQLQLITDEKLKSAIQNSSRIKIIPPASFLEMIVLESNCKLVMTDSGGVQKEAYYFGKPCIILRPETEWRELLECGAAELTGSDENKIIQAVDKFFAAYTHPTEKFYGDGNAAEFICQKIITCI